jgi:hypothetical protein
VKLGCQHVRCNANASAKLSCLHTGRVHPYHHWDPGRVIRFNSTLNNMHCRDRGDRELVDCILQLFQSCAFSSSGPLSFRARTRHGTMVWYVE